MTEDLGRRMTVLEDIESIKNLKASYCYLVDAAVAGDTAKWDQLLIRFTDDARADFDMLGVFEGKIDVEKLYRELVASSLSYSAHMVSNPIIEVDGEEAKGRWYVIVPCTSRVENRAAWIQGRYEEEYVKENGEWKWRSITVRFDHITPFDEGWVKTRFSGV